MLVILQGIYEDVLCNVRCDKGETDLFPMFKRAQARMYFMSTTIFLSYSSGCK